MRPPAIAVHSCAGRQLPRGLPTFRCRLDCPTFRVPPDLMVKHEQLVFAALDALKPVQRLSGIVQRYVASCMRGAGPRAQSKQAGASSLLAGSAALPAQHSATVLACGLHLGATALMPWQVAVRPAE